MEGGEDGERASAAGWRHQGLPTYKLESVWTVQAGPDWVGTSTNRLKVPTRRIPMRKWYGFFRN